jgi:protocatechuate 3,4-dioxygenase beta subunit
LAIGPPGEPYLVSALPAEVDPIDAETTVDFVLKRGVWIRGRVTDASDGRPLRAHVEYAVFDENPHLEEAPGYSDAFSLWYHTDADGRYQIPGFPGRGIVGVRAHNYSDYPKGAGAEAIEPRETSDGRTFFRTDPHLMQAENYHAVAAVSPDENGGSNEYNFALMPGRSLTGTVVDPQGEPLAGAMVHGAILGGIWQSLDEATFSVRNIDPTKPRLVQFYHTDCKLAGSILVKGDESGPLEVQLEPWATVTGRIVDTQGDPMLDASLASEAGALDQWGAMPGQWDFPVDDQGRFQVEGLAPNLPYYFRIGLPGRSLGTKVKDLRLSAGETKDLGDLSVKRPSN